MAINALLFISVLVLFVLHFSNTGNEETGPIKMEHSVGDTLIDPAAIVFRFVNTDSIWNNYNYVDELRENLNRKQKQYQSEMERKIAEFQSNLQEFQENMMSLSPAEGEKKQQELMMKEQGLQQLQQEYNLKLIEEEDKMKEQLRNKIAEYLKEYHEKGVDLILDNSASSSVLLYHDSLDITTEVLKGLNGGVTEKQAAE